MEISKCLFCISGNNHMIFLFRSINMMNYVMTTPNIEPLLHSSKNEHMVLMYIIKWAIC